MNDLPSPSLDAPGLAPARHSWLETAALCALALTAGALAGGAPLVFRPGLAWLALAPLLAGLRYGAGHGVACGAALSGALLAAARWGGTGAEAPLGQVALGWLVAGLLAGQFRDAWARRLGEAEGEAGALRERLRSVTRSYHAIKLSHERLQREIPGSPSTLADALAAFEAGSPRALGERVLALFRECAPVRAATLYPVDGGGRVGSAVATLGAVEGHVPGWADALVRESVRLGEVVSVRDVPAGRGALAAVPLVDPEGRVRAVVAIHDLPFLALQGETLAILALLGAHAGAALAERLAELEPGLEAPSREDGLVA